jgi:hypothetical protein
MNTVFKRTPGVAARRHRRGRAGDGRAGALRLRFGGFTLGLLALRGGRGLDQRSRRVNSAFEDGQPSASTARYLERHDPRLAATVG